MSLLEPERIGPVDAEERARVPVVQALLRDVSQLRAHDDRLRHAAYHSDAELLVGVDAEHALPDFLALFRIRSRAPLVVELKQLNDLGDVGLEADRAASLEILTELRPLQLLLGGRRKHVRT